jgi:hypothetical protein
LRDNSTATKKPYSFSRVQIAWWTIIVLAAFISIIITTKGTVPTFDSSTLILLGISSGTLATASAIDAATKANAAISANTISQNSEGISLLHDILTDNNGVNIHRLQTVIFNIVFGVWFIVEFTHNMNHASTMSIDELIPKITDNNLILLGLSSGTYAALKTLENKAIPTPAPSAPTTTTLPSNLPAAPIPTDSESVAPRDVNNFLNS